MKYEKEIINIINKNIHLSNLTGKIDIDTNLCDLGFDSISFIRVIIEIEDKFNIEFPEENLTLSKLSTIRNLCNCLDEIINL